MLIGLLFHERGKNWSLIIKYVITLNKMTVFENYILVFLLKSDLI